MIQIPTPGYHKDLTPEESATAHARFLIKLAALYYSPGGQVKDLSAACGLAPGHLSSLLSISPETAIKIEKVLGRELFPRELFRPDLFLIKE